MRLGKHIAVIGAGVVGLAIALKLRREGYRVIVFEPDEPGSHASRGNASLIMTAQVAPISEPGLWRKVPFMLSDPHSPLLVRWTHLPRMTPWFKRFLRNNRRRQYQAITETLAPLTARSLDAWIALIGASEGDRLFKQDGLLYVFRTPKAFRAGKKDAAFRNQHGVYSEVIPAEELSRPGRVLHRAQIAADAASDHAAARSRRWRGPWGQRRRRRWPWRWQCDARAEGRTHGKGERTRR
jgi:D-amino-acid dehydrogenase